MATISRNFESEQTDGTLSSASVTTGTNSGNVDLSTYEGAHVHIDANFPSSPTDDLEVEVYGSTDGTNYDDTPMFAFTIDNGTDPNQVSFVVKDVYAFRVRVARSGSTDTITVTMKYRRWNWSSA